MQETDNAVLIAGGGPTGLMLAGELALAGADVAIIEKRESQALAGSRAGGLHSRTIEILDQRGIAERLLAEGQKVPVGQFAGVPMDISDFPTRHNYGLGLWQNHIERTLAGWVDELGVPVHRGCSVTGLANDPDCVRVELSDGRTLRAQYLVGCDGGRSLVRKAARIEFPGSDATTSAMIAEVELADEPEWGIHHDSLGQHALGRVEYEIRDGEIVYADSGPVRVMVSEAEVGTGVEPTLEELSEAMKTVYGTDYGVHSPTWISRFTDMSRQAATYRKDRVLLAGDAAHVHAPDGGQGLNTGLQDAVNLGWKLARVVNGTSPESLLDTYHAERHPVGALVLRNAMAMVALRRPDDRTRALAATVAEMVGMEEPGRRLAAMFSGLDIRYELGGSHPLAGRRMPDLDLETDDGARRVYPLLHDARPLLIDFGEKKDDETVAGAAAWSGQVKMIDAVDTGPWEIPVRGEVPAPSAVLVRPDGYVAWAGNPADQALVEVLTLWFGRPA